MNKDFKLSVELGTLAKDELVDIVDHIWAQSCLHDPEAQNDHSDQYHG